MTRIEEKTVKNLTETVSDLWAKYLTVRSPYLYEQWQKKKGKLDAYLEKMILKYKQHKPAQ